MKAFLKLIGVAALIVFAVLFINANVSIVTPETPGETAQRELREANIVKGAQPIPYKSLAREPNAHMGKPVMFSGKVIQVVENGTSVTLRVNVTKLEYHWDDTVYVEYRKKSRSEARILDDDIVKFYGTFEGIKSYQAIFGNTIQIPHVKAVTISGR